MMSNELREDSGSQNRLVEENQAIDLEYETDAEEVLRRIYDSFVLPQEGMVTPRRQERPFTISTPNEATSKDVCIKFVRGQTSMIEDRDLTEAL